MGEVVINVTAEEIESQSDVVFLAQEYFPVQIQDETVFTEVRDPYFVISLIFEISSFEYEIMKIKGKVDNQNF